jgi:predicted nucleic acid-binding protein
MNVKNRISEKYFIDTNIFVYCFDKSNQDKKVRSMDLISEGKERPGMV